MTTRKATYIAACIGLALSSEAEPETTEERGLLYYYACHYAEMYYSADCNKLPVPLIVDMDSDKYGGYYRVENPQIVWINSLLPEDMRQVTIVHEMAHYIFHMSEEIVLEPGNALQNCLSEAVSFGISNRFAVEYLKQPELQRHIMKRAYTSGTSRRILLYSTTMYSSVRKSQ